MDLLKIPLNHSGGSVKLFLQRIGTTKKRELAIFRRFALSSISIMKKARKPLAL